MWTTRGWTENWRADAAPARYLIEGSFSQELTKEQIQRTFWGPEGKPEVENPKNDSGDLPWMLFWQGYTLTGSALYDRSGSLLWLNIWGENEEADSSFTLTLRPGELPLQCGLYSDVESTDVMGTPVTGWTEKKAAFIPAAASSWPERWASGLKIQVEFLVRNMERVPRWSREAHRCSMPCWCGRPCPRTAACTWTTC